MFGGRRMKWRCCTHALCSTTMATTAATIGTTQDDSWQEVVASQLKDELVFKWGGYVMG
jgi:hypothetical protein